MKEMKDLIEYAHENHVPIMMDDGLSFLLEQMEKNRCHSFLEIGTAIGRTSLMVHSKFKDIRIVTIERDPQMIEQAKKNFEGISNIQLIEGDALDIQLAKDESFDCIFIDAAKAQYTRFFAKYSPLLSKNGIIVSDNMDFHGLVAHPENTQNRNTKALVKKIRRYKEFLKALVDYETEFYSIGDGIAVTKRRQSR